MVFHLQPTCRAGLDPALQIRRTVGLQQMLPAQINVGRFEEVHVRGLRFRGTAIFSEYELNHLVGPYDEA